MLATTDAAITQAIFSQFTLEEWLLFSKPLMPFTISHSMLKSWAAVQNPGKKTNICLYLVIVSIIKITILKFKVYQDKHLNICKPDYLKTLYGDYKVKLHFYWTNS